MTVRRLFFPDYPAGRLGWALLLLRLVAGTAFFLHGAQKMARPFSWMGNDAWAPGFLQFLAPTISFVIGVAQGEPFTPLRALSFGFIWLGAAVFLYGAWRKTRRLRTRPA